MIRLRATLALALLLVGAPLTELAGVPFPSYLRCLTDATGAGSDDMTEAERLDRVLAASWNGDAWYGPNASMILEGIDAETAATKILPGLHTIHELVFHVAAWLDEVRMLLGGAEPNMTRGFDWPEPGPVTADDWDRTRAGLGEAYRAFSEVLRALPLDRLDEVVGPERDPAEGTGLTVHAVLVGLAQHGAYHLGQIVLLAKHKRMRTD